MPNWRDNDMITVNVMSGVEMMIQPVGKEHDMRVGLGYDVHKLAEGRELIMGGVKIPYEIKDRRPGDIATCYSDASKAEKELGWKAENGIREMCEDSWRWQKNNPNGYED